MYNQDSIFKREDLGSCEVVCVWGGGGGCAAWQLASLQ